MKDYAFPSRWNGLAFRAIDRIVRRNSPAGSSRNVRAHYDVGNEFYGEWLDPSFTYSSALFGEGDDLERGQARKYDRILDRLGDRERILEIGCGWGGFAERAAGRGHAVTAVTVSPSQKAYADARLDGRADIQLRDYRATSGRHPAIVSIEMVEAVGERYWPTYFATLRDRLAEGGKAVVQAITVSDGYFPQYRRGTPLHPTLDFPGGMLLCNRAITEQAARAGLRADTPFAFGLDYARTCRQWAERLMDRRERLAALGYGGPTSRHWALLSRSLRRLLRGRPDRRRAGGAYPCLRASPASRSGSPSSSPSLPSASSRPSVSSSASWRSARPTTPKPRPRLDIRAVLNGPLIASGVIHGPDGRVATRFVAQMQGAWDARARTLAEDFQYDTGRIQQRVWHLVTGANGRFTATADDVGRHRRGRGTLAPPRSCAIACACPRTPAAGRST